MTAALKNLPERALRTGATIVLSVVGTSLAIAYGSLAWGLSSRDKLVTSQLERHTTQLGDLEENLQDQYKELRSDLRTDMTGLCSDLHGDIMGLSAEFNAWTRAFTAQFAATNARIDASNARIDATAASKAP